MVHITIEVVAVRTARLESALRGSDDPIWRLYECLELRRHFVLIRGEQRVARLRLPDRPVIAVGTYESMRNREAEGVDAGCVAVVPAGVEREFNEIPNDVVVRISRIIDVGTGVAIVGHFDEHRRSDAQEHPTRRDGRRRDDLHVAQLVIDVRVVVAIFRQMSRRVVQRGRRRNEIAVSVQIAEAVVGVETQHRPIDLVVGEVTSRPVPDLEIHDAGPARYFERRAGDVRVSHAGFDRDRLDRRRGRDINRSRIRRRRCRRRRTVHRVLDRRSCRCRSEGDVLRRRVRSARWRERRRRDFRCRRTSRELDPVHIVSSRRGEQRQRLGASAQVQSASDGRPVLPASCVRHRRRIHDGRTVFQLNLPTCVGARYAVLYGVRTCRGYVHVIAERIAGVNPADVQTSFRASLSSNTGHGVVAFRLDFAGDGLARGRIDRVRGSHDWRIRQAGFNRDRFNRGRHRHIDSARIRSRRRSRCRAIGCVLDRRPRCRARDRHALGCCVRPRRGRKGRRRSLSARPSSLRRDVDPVHVPAVRDRVDAQRLQAGRQVHRRGRRLPVLPAARVGHRYGRQRGAALLQLQLGSGVRAGQPELYRVRTGSRYVHRVVHPVTGIHERHVQAALRAGLRLDAAHRRVIFRLDFPRISGRRLGRRRCGEPSRQ